jgi:transposase
MENIVVKYDEETERLLFEQEQKQYADNVAIAVLFEGLKRPATKSLIESLQQIEQYQKDVEQLVLNLHKENNRLRLENIDLLNKLVKLMTDKK